MSWHKKFCPACGMMLLHIATGSGKVEPTDTEKQNLVYYICGTCKDLLMSYGDYGYHFKMLGTITDETLAVMIADSLKGEKT